MSALRADGLQKSFGGVRAVDGVSMTLGDGEIVALIGPNGAGKSTLFNLIDGQLRPDAGHVNYDGHALDGLPTARRTRLGIGRTFQVAQAFASMTALQNAQVALAAARDPQSVGAPLWDRHAEAGLALLGRVGLAERAAEPASALAYGDLKRLELALALATEPRLLLMDEPTAGMAPRERSDTITLVKRLVTERGIAVLFTEHSMDVVFAFADRIIVMARGSLIAEGDAAAIRDNAQVQEVYLGTGKAYATPGAAAQGNRP